MSNIKSLFKTKWIEVLEKTTKNNGIYIYTHAPWTNGHGVAILPFRHPQHHITEYLGRYEICPAHSDEVELCSITGGCDVEGEDYAMTALRELEEEAGYIGNINDIISLGTVRPSKSSDSIQHLFAIRIHNGTPRIEATGDGTLGEVGAYCEWVSEEDIVFSKDPLLSTMMSRLAYEI